MLLKFFTGLVGKGLLAKVLTASAIMVLAWLLARLLRRVGSRHSANPRTHLLRGLFYYGTLVAGAFAALESVGYDPGPLLVTGGLVSVAVGFASQTSLSNFIGGLFLAADEPFKVGDYVRVNDQEGVVLSVDPLSTKLRTLQNVYVRIPNEALLKGVILNFSHYALRRVDVGLQVPVQTPIGTLRAALEAAAQSCEAVLVEPPPFVQIEGAGELTLRVQLRIWVRDVDMMETRGRVYEAVGLRLAAAGIPLGAPPGTFTVPDRTASALLPAGDRVA